MKRLIFIAIVLSNTVLLSFDRFFDISLTTDFANLKERSHVDFNSQATFPFLNKAFSINPRLSVFFDGTMDVSVATGLRHELKWGTLGHHVFWDSSGPKDTHFHQLGHSLDFLTSKFDFRVNYYHPITQQQFSKKFRFCSHRWFEAEAIWKNKLCQASIGPKYDLFNKEWGAQARVVFPYKFFSIGSLLSYEKSSRLSACFSLSFRLFSTPRSSFLQSPICHRSRVQYSKQIILVPVRIVEKREEEKPDTPPSKVEEVGAPSEEVATVLPPSPPPPPPKHWWDFFFHQDKINQVM